MLVLITVQKKQGPQYFLLRKCTSTPFFRLSYPIYVS